MMTFYFELPHLAINDTKMQIPDKKYRTYTVCTFWGTWSVSALRYLGLDHFVRMRTKVCGIQVKLWKKSFSVLDSVVEALLIFPAQGIFFFLAMSTKDSEKLVLRVSLKSCFVPYERNLKTSILSTKSSCIRRLSNKDVYMWIMVCYRSIPEACS